MADGQLSAEVCRMTEGMSKRTVEAYSDIEKWLYFLHSRAN